MKDVVFFAGNKNKANYVPELLDTSIHYTDAELQETQRIGNVRNYL